MWIPSTPVGEAHGCDNGRLYARHDKAPYVSSMTREEKAANNAAYHAANREEIAARQAAYRAVTREEKKAYDATHYAAHREEKAAYYAAYREEKAHLEEANPNWAGDEIGYGGQHKRVRRANGSAASYNCVDCGEPAGQWSYAHGCPDERTEINQRNRLVPFCPHVEHYAPRCHSCHKLLDSEKSESYATPVGDPC